MRQKQAMIARRAVHHCASLQLTFRAQNLRDVVVHLYAGHRLADELVHRELAPDERERYAVALRRVFLSTIPVVAEAAALDLAEIGGEHIPDYARREFPAEAF